MPINFDLNKIRIEHQCCNYFETGLYDPRCNVSSKQALLCEFDKLFCIEIREDWVNLGKDIFKNEITKGRYNIYLDDSTNMQKYIMNDDFKNKTIFFLDAHVDNNNIHNYKYKCPLFDELNAISCMERKDNIILIDDLRIITTSFPWGENSYGDIDFLKQIKHKILSINKDYKFDTLDGHVANDVLFAYI